VRACPLVLLLSVLPSCPHTCPSRVRVMQAPRFCSSR
jgi:hypothetical protein